MWSSIVQQFSRGWKWLDLDRKTLALMIKACIPVAISLSIYQSTPVSEVYTSLGFLVSIIAVVTVNMLPRAKLIQLTFTICLWTAIAIPLSILAAWSALQARLHTDPRGLSKYNSSQSAVTAVWLFFHIWLSNSLQGRYPALLIATILYNIFMIVQFTSVATYTTWTQCWSIIYLTIRCYYTSVAISFFSGILVYPVTCRTEISEMQEKFLGAARGSLEAMIDYVGELSSLSPRNQDGSDSDGDGEGDKTKTAGATLKQKVGGLKGLYVKMHEELVMAKREIAWGKLRARDLTALGDLDRRILMPIQGLAHIADILQRIEDNGGWMPFENVLSGHEKTAGSKTACNTEDTDAMWQACLAALIGPASNLMKAVGDGLEHAGLQLEIIPRPGSKSYVRRLFGARNKPINGDTEVGDDVTRPGAPGFSRTLEQQLQRFAVERVKAMDAWVNYEGLPADQIGRLYGEMQNAPKDLLRDHQQLYLLLYMQQMMYSTAIGVLELDRFADSLVAEGVMARNRLIVPSGRRLWKWFLSLFDVADTAVAEDDRPGSKKESTLLYGKSTRKTRDIEHLPPKNHYERFGVKIHRFQEFLKGPEFSFGFRSALATMSCAIVYYLEPTQLIFVHYRLIWSVIIAAIGANMTAGQSGVSYILRILGSFAALFICWLVWYIPDGHVAGVIVFMTLAAFYQNYCLIRGHRYIIGWLVIIIAEVLSIGYELQVKKIGIQAAESTGVLWYHPYTVCAMRVACVLWGTCASIFFTYLPYPITARSSMRKNIATVMRLIGNYHTVVHTTLQARLAGTEGDTTTKGTSGHALLRTRKTIFNKCTALTASVAHSVYLQKYEPTLGGRFPVEIYTDILTNLSTLLDYVALLSYATQPWSPHAPYFHTSTRTREWIDALSALSRSTDVLEHRITAILYHLASCLATGHPLHQPIERLEPYRLSRRLRQLDPGLLDVRHVGDLGYATFAVVEVVERMVTYRVNLLIERVEGLVGVGGFHVGGNDVS